MEKAEGRERGGKGGEEWKLLGTVALSGVLFNRDCPIKHPILADGGLRGERASDWVRAGFSDVLCLYIDS